MATTDPTGGPRGSTYYFDDIEFEARAGDAFVIEVTRASFDSFIYVLGIDCETLASNDDGGSGLLSRLEWTAPENGIYTIVVTSYGSLITGSYTVSLSPLEPPCEPGACCYATSRELASEISGSLAVSDPTDGPRGIQYYRDSYEFEIESGMEFFAEVVSASFDTYLYLFDESCQTVAANDDGAGGLLSLIQFTAEATGRYTLMITSFGAYQTGNYSIVSTGF